MSSPISIELQGQGHRINLSRCQASQRRGIQIVRDGWRFPHLTGTRYAVYNILRYICILVSMFI